MRVCRAPIGPGFDTSVYVEPKQAQAMKAAGALFRIGYVRRDQQVNDVPDPPSQWPISWSKRELNEHLDTGLLCGFVQFPRMHGRNYLSAETGAQLGFNAAWNVSRLGVPDGATIFADAEWTDNPPAAVVLAFLREWGRGCIDGGGRPGPYVGFEGLTGEQWHSLPGQRCYWRSAMVMRTYQRASAPTYEERIGHMSEPLPRGWGVLQGWQHSDKTDDVAAGRPAVCGIEAIDPCWVTYDNLGDRPWFASA